MGFFEVDFHPFWPFEFNFDVFGFRNWDPLVIMGGGGGGGLTSGLLKYLALPVWWVGRIASLDFHSRAHLPLGCQGVELNAVWQVLPLTADNGRDHLNRPLWSIHLVLAIIDSRFKSFNSIRLVFSLVPRKFLYQDS